MRNFYIVVPALSLLNMGVNGATIVNTLTARDDAHAEGNGLYKRMILHHQDRQFHSADFSSGPDADAGAEVQTATPDLPAAPESEPVSPRTILDDFAPTVSTDALVAEVLSTLGSREVQPAMAFKRRINGAPHEMARHSKRQIISGLLKGVSSQRTASSNALTHLEKTVNPALVNGLTTAENLVSIDDEAAFSTTTGLLSNVKTDGTTLSNSDAEIADDVVSTFKKLGGLTRRGRLAVGPYQRDNEDEDLGERAPSDRQSLGVSRGMHGRRQIQALTSEPIMDDVPIADINLGSRSDRSTSTKMDYRSIIGDLPPFEGDVQKRPRISPLSRDLPVAVPAAVSSTAGSLPVVGGAVDRRAPGNTSRGLMKIATFKRIPAVDANIHRADVARMIKRKSKRQEEVEAADTEMGTEMVGGDTETSTDDAGENAGSLDDVD